MPSRSARIVRTTFLGLLVGGVGGYVVGALIGIALTWYNNNVDTDTPYGSYLWWAHFMGTFICIFTAPIGLLVGLLYGIGRVRIDGV